MFEKNKTAANFFVMCPLTSCLAELCSHHLWEAATVPLQMRNKITAKGHVGVRKNRVGEKKYRVGVGKTGAQTAMLKCLMTRRAADWRCEAAEGERCNCQSNQSSLASTQPPDLPPGVGGLSLANHALHPACFWTGVAARSAIFQSTGPTLAPFTENCTFRALLFFPCENLRLSEIIFLRKGGRRCCPWGGEWLLSLERVAFAKGKV